MHTPFDNALPLLLSGFYRCRDEETCLAYRDLRISRRETTWSVQPHRIGTSKSAEHWRDRVEVILVPYITIADKDATCCKEDGALVLVLNKPRT